MDERYQILIVDDESDIRTIIRVPLEAKGYVVYEAENGEKALEILKEKDDIDLIILDVMMPGTSGYDACAQIREIANVPVLFLTALTQEENRLEAYNSGGDDFLGKPFSQAELLMKVDSLLRRYRVYKGKGDFRNFKEPRNYVLDKTNRAIIKNGERILLTDIEYEIAKYLVESRGRSVSIKEIYEGVWKEKYFSTDANTVMVHILRLRRKVEDNPSEPVFIKTVWGKGYQVD